MCINCNIHAPIHHAVCDIFGIPKNVFQTRSSLWEPGLGQYIRTIGHDEQMSEFKSLHDYCVKNDIVQRLTDAYQADKMGFGIISNHVINYVTFSYFGFKSIDDAGLTIPTEVCTLLGGKDDYLLRGTWVQMKLIPPDVVEKYKLDGKFEQTAEEYGIQLLQDQVWYIHDSCSARPSSWLRGFSAPGSNGGSGFL